MGSLARRYSPYIPEELTQHIVRSYVSMRKDEDIDGQSEDGQAGGTTYTTARTLLSVLRLAQALARLRFEEEVIKEDVDEAIRLMEASSKSLAERARGKKEDDPKDAIYHIILEHMKRRGVDEAKLSEIEPLVLAEGYTDDQYKECISEYEDLNVWQC